MICLLKCHIEIRIFFQSLLFLTIYVCFFLCFILQTSNKSTLIAYFPALTLANWTNHYTVSFAKQIIYPTKPMEQFSYYVLGVIKSTTYLVIGQIWSVAEFLCRSIQEWIKGQWSLRILEIFFFYISVFPVVWACTLHYVHFVTRIICISSCEQVLCL